MIVLVEIAILLILSVYGAGTVKLLERIFKIRFIKNKVLYPVIGSIFLIWFLQLSNLFFSVKNISYILLIFFLASLFFSGKDFISCVFRIRKNIFLIILLIFSLIICSLPVLIHGGICSIQNFNNDIIYYLSSMDWLQNHSWLEKIEYSFNQPYFALAEYILRYTRYGLDLLGAFFMSIFNFEAHEIYFALSVAVSNLLCIAFYYTSRFLFEIDNVRVKMGLTIIISGGVLTNLIASQYAPQILGMAYMILFIGLIIKEIENENYKNNLFFISLIISATITTYAEYAVNIAAIMIVLFVIYSYQNRKFKYAIKDKFVRFVKIAAVSIIINPIAIIVGVRLNFRILGLASDGISNIDPFLGKIKNIYDFIAQILGMQDATRLDLYAPNSLSSLYKVCMIILIIILVIGCIIGSKKKGDTKKYILGIIIFYSLYELYFRLVKNAYGEYKHLISIAPVILIFILYLWDFFEISEKIKTIIGEISVIFIITGNLALLYSDYQPRDLVYFDEEVEEVKDSYSLIPEDEIPGVLNTDAWFQHSIVYALKNENLVLTGSGRSYFSLLMDIDDIMTKYLYCEYEKNNLFNVDIFEINSETLWHNERFALIKNLDDLFMYVESGFSVLEENDMYKYRWTNAKESYIALNNLNSTEDRTIKLKFFAEDSPDGEKNIKIYYDDKIIGEATTGQWVETEMFTLSKGEIGHIKIVSEEELSKVEGDSREFGFLMRNVQVIEN